MIEVERGKSHLSHILRDLFAFAHLTFVDSFLDGCMGRGWVDHPDDPTCAQITVGDVSFLAGDHTAADAVRFVDNVPSGTDGSGFLFVPENEAWVALILARHGDKARRVTRYAFRKDGEFPTERLAEMAARPPAGYTLEPIGEERYREILASPMRDLCSRFDSAEDYVRRGVGFCAVREGRIAGGASSYTVYRGGIEIEVDIAEEHRRRGIATACSARLILECLERGIYPSWDAANPESAALARKLGYVFSHEYEVCAVDF